MQKYALWTQALGGTGSVCLGLGQRSVLGPLVKDRMPVSRAEQVVPGPEVMFPEVGINPGLGPHPMMIPEPEPEPARTVGVSVCPAQLGMVDPAVVVGPEGAQPRKIPPTARLGT